MLRLVPLRLGISAYSLFLEKYACRYRNLYRLVKPADRARRLAYLYFTLPQKEWTTLQKQSALINRRRRSTPRKEKVDRRLTVKRGSYAAFTKKLFYTDREQLAKLPFEKRGKYIADKWRHSKKL